MPLAGYQLAARLALTSACRPRLTCGRAPLPQQVGLQAVDSDMIPSDRPADDRPVGDRRPLVDGWLCVPVHELQAANAAAARAAADRAATARAGAARAGAARADAARAGAARAGVIRVDARRVVGALEGRPPAWSVARRPASESLVRVA